MWRMQIDLEPKDYRVNGARVAQWWQPRQRFLERNRKALLRWATACGIWVVAFPQVAAWADLYWVPSWIRWALFFGPVVTLFCVAVFNDREA